MAEIIIIHTHTCLVFNELSEQDKAKVLERYRDYNVYGFDWWDYTFEGFAERMLGKGVEIDLARTYFSLGYTQSDYAAITAQVVDIDKFLIELGGFDSRATRLIRFAVQNGYVRNVGCAERNSSTYVNIEWNNPHENYQGGNSAAYDYADTILADFADSVTSYFKYVARELYNALREDYEGQTSEEALAYTFEANDCVFEIGTGKMYYA